MKPYLLSLGAGLVVGLVYSLMGVRSPAPPAIALIGLLGILLGEQALPLAGRLLRDGNVFAFTNTQRANQMPGPQAHEDDVA